MAHFILIQSYRENKARFGCEDRSTGLRVSLFVFHSNFANPFSPSKSRERFSVPGYLVITFPINGICCNFCLQDNPNLFQSGGCTHMTEIFLLCPPQTITYLLSCIMKKSLTATKLFYFSISIQKIVSYLLFIILIVSLKNITCAYTFVSRFWREITISLLFCSIFRRCVLQ